MCIALPRKIVAVVDAARALVAVAGDDPGGESNTDPEIVSAVLITEPGADVTALVGTWTLVHAGFALTSIDEDDARSRLQVFAAISGAATPLDLDDFHRSQRPPADQIAPAGPPEANDGKKA